VTEYTNSLVYVGCNVSYKLHEQRGTDIMRQNLGVPNSKSINESGGHCQNNWVKHVWDTNKAAMKRALGR